MAHGFSVKIFGRSYLLAVLMPEDVPDYCEFRREIAGQEQILGEDGWDTVKRTKAKKVFRDPHGSSIYFTYFLDENAGPGAKYSFRTRKDGVFSPWRTLENARRSILPAPRNVRAQVKHGNSK